MNFKLLAFTVFQLLFSLKNTNAQVIPIADARQLNEGETVTVRGIVTNGPELGRIRYFQDNTAGIGAFPGPGSPAGFETNVGPGDEIEITGKLLDFNGLLEISPIISYQILSKNNPQPAPVHTTLGKLDESLEGRLISLDCVTFANPGANFPSGTTPINDSDGGAGVIYLRGAHPVVGTPIPTQSVRLTAILSQFNDYQILPRSVDDFSSAVCFFISEQPTESNLSTDGLTINWKTNKTSTSFLKYGPTPQLGSQTISPASGTTHFAPLLGLQPGQIYWVQAVAINGSDTAYSEVVPFATVSISSGRIKVFFNKGIDDNAAATLGLFPDGDTWQEALAETITRIDSAKYTIDVAMYNNNRVDITNALKAAHARGVRVRYVAAEDGSSPALDPPPVFPVIYGNAFDLMHNKFMVVDANYYLNCWVMSGSMNWTNGQITEDPNNTLFIQDQSLARSYELEFNEMWGGSDDQPDPAKARFGSAKRDNTPHHFIIGGRPAESYFSPSDQTTRQIERVIRSADEDFFFGLLTFTKDELGQAILDRHAAGVACRGIIDNWNDNGSEYWTMLANNVPVVGHTLGPIFHHKYGVADATLPSSDPTVLTGSHNWSLTAETGNDENTLIIHDADIARLYWLEFQRRWTELNVSTEMPENQRVRVFPNPADTRISVVFEENFSEKKQLWLCDALGKNWISTADFSENQFQTSVSQLPDGLYFLKILSENGRFTTVPFQKISR